MTAADIARLDVPAEEVRAQIRDLVARQREQSAAAIARTERIRQGRAAEARHLLHDADPDSTVPVFAVDLTKHQPKGTS